MDSGKRNERLGDGQEVASSSRKGKNHLTDHQHQMLEALFKECPHPDQKQRHRLGMELGIDPTHIKYWFQNMRNQTKAQYQRAENYTLRKENEKMLYENLIYKESLESMICTTCGAPAREHDRQTTLHKLKMEHLQLREQYIRMRHALTKQLGMPLFQIDEQLNSYTGSILDSSSSWYPRNQGSRISSVDLDDKPAVIPCNLTLLAQQTTGTLGTTNDSRVEIALKALKELVMLLQMNEPFWIKSNCGKYTLDRNSYERMFSRFSHYKTPSARIESSKDSKDVNIRAIDLVCMFLDPDQWAHNFCTIVRKADTIEVLHMETLRQQSGHLQQMYAQMHILSPLVAPREFYFLRYCQQMEAGIWIVVDESYDYIKQKIVPSCSWRFPSGCMIHEMPNGFSKVTWVEHVEVDDKTRTHKLYREVLGIGFAYGAERWTDALQRMGERLNSTNIQNLATPDHGGVKGALEGKRSIMELSHRMVKNFCSILNMANPADASRVKVSVSTNTDLGQPSGIIISAATSLWLPLPLDVVFHFLTDENTRNQWDVLASGLPVQKVANIDTANQPGNFMSIIKPTTPNETNKLILQECSVDNLTALVVYAPFDIPSFNIAMAGEDTSSIPLLPSGFTIIDDGGLSQRGVGPHPKSGSLLTVAIQRAVNNSSTSEQVNAESIAHVNTIISAMTLKIKMALNCGGMD